MATEITELTAEQGFDEDYYLNEKAAQLTNSTGTDWTVDDVQAAFEEAGLTASEHFLLYGYDEGLSANAYFNADEYAESKAAAAGETVEEFKAAWKAASGSDNLYLHYIQYGAYEDNVSPATGFDDGKYYEAKAAELTATTGQTWTVAQVQTAFGEAGLNPISHYQLYGKDEGLSYTPTPIGVTGKTYDLTTDIDTIIGTDWDDTINGVSSALSAEKTLNPGDLIDGAAGTDTLNVTMSSSFTGFSGDGYLKNVENVNLTSASTIAREFDASGVTDVEKYTIDASKAAVNLKDLGDLGSTIDLENQASGSFSIAYAKDVTSGTSDTQALAFNNVGTVKSDSVSEAAVTTTISGVEALTLAVTGDNVAAFTAADTTALTVTGAGNLKLTAVPAALKTLDASAATGNLNVDLTGATTNTVTSATMGSGDDTLTIDSASVSKTAELAGGAGDDTLVIGSTGVVQYTQGGFETVQLANTAALTLSAANTTDLTTIDVAKGMNSTATLASLGTNDYTVDLLGNNAAGTGALTLDNSGATTINVSSPAADATTKAPTANNVDVTLTDSAALTMTVDTKMDYQGTVTAAKATSATVDIAGETTGATIAAAAATSVVVSAVANASTLTLTADKATDLNVTAAKDLDLTGSSVAGLEALTVNTAGTFTLPAALAKISTVSLEGTGSVDLGNLGASSQDEYGISLTAAGLSTDKATGTTSLNVGTIDTDGQAITVDAAGVMGVVNIGAIDAKGDTASSVGDVTVDLNGTGGKFTLGAITGKNVTLNAAGALGTAAYGGITFSGDTLVFAGANTTTNTLNVTANGSSFAAQLTGGLTGDTITMTAAATDFASATLSGDLGSGTDTITFDGSAVTATAGEKIDLSGLAGVEVATVTAGTGADTITVGSGIAADTLIGATEADKLYLGDGADKVQYLATNGVSAEGGDTIYSFGTSSDSIVFSSTLAVVTNGTLAVNSEETLNTTDVNLIAGTLATGDDADSVAAYLTSMTITAAADSQAIFMVNNGTDSYVWSFIDSNSNTTIDAADIKLVATIDGVASGFIDSNFANA